jgi:hypothetical protein
MAPTPCPLCYYSFFFNFLLDLFSLCSLPIRADGRGGGWSQLSRRQLKLAPLPLYVPLGVRVLHSLHRLNMELVSKVYLGSMCTAVLVSGDPRNLPPSPPELGSYTTIIWSAKIDDISLRPPEFTQIGIF